MDFPIVDLFDDDLSAAWLLKYFHSNDLRCPHCGRSVEEARVFRVRGRTETEDGKRTPSSNFRLPPSCHGDKEWARDDDGDGLREVHVNTSEGMWTTVRNFLRPFRGVHKKYLGSYVAICEFSINLKRITPAFISALVTLH